MRPMPIRRATSPITIRSTRPGSAPRAMRIPISFRRRVTLYDITPYSPIIARTRAKRLVDLQRQCLELQGDVAIDFGDRGLHGGDHGRRRTRRDAQRERNGLAPLSVLAPGGARAAVGLLARVSV